VLQGQLDQQDRLVIREQLAQKAQLVLKVTKDCLVLRVQLGQLVPQVQMVFKVKLVLLAQLDPQAQLE
jgi:hypothetical protein